MLKSKLSQLKKLGAASTAEGAKYIQGDNVAIVITSDGIRTIDSLTGCVIHSIFIKNVSYTSAHSPSRKEEVFSFIAQDDRVLRKSCHIFKCPVGQPKLICEVCKLTLFTLIIIHIVVQSVGKAFIECMKDNTADPFRPVATTSQLSIDPILDSVQIQRSTLNAIKVLGAGQFGKVYLADHTSDGTVVNRAVKMLRDNATYENQV